MERETLYRKQENDGFTMEVIEYRAFLNNYGKQFINICLPNKGDR